MKALQKWEMTTRKSEKARAKREGDAARRRCVLTVWERAGHRCELCGAGVKMSSTYFREVGAVDEIVPRAQGGDPHDPDNCRLVCHRCHFSGPSGAHRRTARSWDHASTGEGEEGAGITERSGEAGASSVAGSTIATRDGEG